MNYKQVRMFEVKKTWLLIFQKVGLEDFTISEISSLFPELSINRLGKILQKGVNHNYFTLHKRHYDSSQGGTPVNVYSISENGRK